MMNRTKPYDIKELAAALDVCEVTARSYIRRGWIHAAKLGREYRIHPVEVDRVLSEGLQKGA